MSYYSQITDISLLNSKSRSQSDFQTLFDDGLFSNRTKWNSFTLNNEIPDLLAGIQSRMKYSMSILSLGIYNVMEDGPGKNIVKDEEIYLFTGFGEIEIVNQIGKLISQEDYSINPALFPNSVNHIALCYYTILKKISNYTVAVNNGLHTNLGFVNFLKDRIKIKEPFIITSGENNSEFFSYEENNPLQIVPSFAAYRIIPHAEKGFRFYGKLGKWDEVLSCEIFIQAEYIFADKETFIKLENQQTNKKLYSEYPITKDNPCGIAVRLALPFYYQISGKSLIMEKIKNEYYLWEVII
ncbi:MAG: hypothetical protein MJB14_09250 [Spirochaetes bacterium]|nr:hypothetical protein [Spirochaetota bacterium]